MIFNVSDVVKAYIGVTFTPEMFPSIVQAFCLLEEFEVEGGYYEDKYNNLIESDDLYDNDTRRDAFIGYLKKDVYSIATEHGLRVTEDSEPTLTDLNEIAGFLHRIQRLEDYHIPAYMLSGTRSDRVMLIDLMEYYGLLKKFRLMELIESVSEKFMIGLKEFVNDKAVERSPEEVDHVRRLYIKRFFEYTKDHMSIGRQLYLSGYQDLTLEELNNIVTFNLFDVIEGKLKESVAVAGLDVLSLLIVTKDQYDAPVFKFAKHHALFVNDSVSLTKINGVLVTMMKDFNDYLEAVKKSESLNGQ